MAQATWNTPAAPARPPAAGSPAAGRVPPAWRPTATPPGGRPQPAPPQFTSAYGTYPGYAAYPAPPWDGKATAAFVMGILGFLVAWPILPILAIVFGNQARDEALRHGHPPPSKALTGRRLGIIALAVYGALLALYFMLMMALFAGAAAGAA